MILLPSATATFAQSQSINGLTIQPNATARLSTPSGANAPTQLAINALSIAATSGSVPGGLLDVNSGWALLNGATSAIALALRSLLFNGLAGGTWNGRGISSKVASDYYAEHTIRKYSVGFAFGGDASAQDAKVTVADQTLLLPGQLLIHTLLTGDANMNGKVDFFDLNQVLGYRYNTGGTDATYTQGDLNYDGKVNFFDLSKILAYKYNVGGNTAAYTDGDLNYDGKVNFFDLSIILSGNYNTDEMYHGWEFTPA